MFAHGDADWPGLAKINEEAGEIVQVIGKLMQTHGKSAHWDGTDLAVRLREELADMIAAITFVVERMNDDEQFDFYTRMREKLALFRRWHQENT